MPPHAPQPPKDSSNERYNTEYLVGNLKSQQRKTRWLILSLGIGLLGMLALWATFSPSKHAPQPGAPGSAIPAAHQPAPPTIPASQRSGATQVPSAAPVRKTPSPKH